MKKGIEELNGIVYCANCKKSICKTNESFDNFCPRCGAPLTIEAIDSNQNDEFNIKRDVLRRLNQLADEQNSDSLNKILESYIEEID